MSLVSRRSAVSAALPLLTLVLAALGASPASAQVFTETTDAGFTPQTATAIGAGITSINGTVGFGTDVDLYRFNLSTAGTFTITGTSATIDSNLILLDGNFIGIGASDDQGGGLNSRITTTLAAGTYYIAYGENNITAYSSSTPTSGFLFDNDSGDGNGVVSGQSTPVGSIGSNGGGAGGRTGAYTIGFSQATGGASAAAPEPSALALLLPAVPALGLVLRHRKARN